MRLTNYTDYSLRLLLYLSLHCDRLCTIKEISEYFDISKNHLMKITHHLVTIGYIESVRGRTGGLRLAKKPRDIILGELVRETEEDFNIVECFDAKTNQCRITQTCYLKHVLHDASAAFLDILDQHTLQDLISNQP